MRYALPVLSAVDSVLAQKPEIALESQVFVSPIELIELGVIAVSAAGVATWQPRPGATIPSGGMDLHLRTEDAILGVAGDPSITLNATLVGVAYDPMTPTTAVASLDVPSWVADQGKSFPVGRANDFVPAGAGNDQRLITAVHGIGAVTNLPPNSEFTVWASPAAANFVEIGYKRSVSGPYQVPGSVEIADRYKSAAVIKKGRSETAELDMQFVHVTSMGGLARYNGQRVSVWVKIVKDKQVHTENILYAGYRPESSPTRGDGNDEVMEQSTGPYESFLTFVAP